jgi:hypothetical protein
VELKVTNSSSSSRGVLLVEKGCGVVAELRARHRGETFYHNRQCFVSAIANISNSSWSQAEVCYCQGSQCNPALRPGPDTALLLSVLLLTRLVFGRTRITISV